MREILLVAGQELWVNLRRPGYIIMTLAVPALGLLVLIIGSSFGGQVGDLLESQFTPNQTAIGYVDRSGLIEADLPQYSERFVPFSTEDAARKALLAEEISSYFVLTPEYVETGKVKVYSTGGGFSSFAAADSGEIRAFLVDHLLTGRVDPAIQERAAAPLDAEPVTLDEQGQEADESPFSWIGDFVVPYVFSILFVITLFTSSGFLLQSVSEEKEGRIIEILLSSISPTELLAGKILGLGALGLIQVVVWFGAGAALLGAAAAIFTLAGAIDISLTTIVLALVYFLLGFLLFATLMGVAGSMGTTQRESQQIGGIFSFAAAIPWMLMGVILNNPNAGVAVVLSYIPFTAPTMMLIRLGFGSVPPGQIVISLVLLVLGIAFTLWAGSKVFRASLLMYGKRPGLRDLVRAFKQA